MTDKIKIVLTSFFYLVIFNSFSQPTITDRNELGGGWIRNPAEKNYIEGTRYLHDDFRSGFVFYDGNSKSPRLLLRLNLHNDEFQFMENDSVFAFAEPSRIDKIIMEDEVFIYIDTSRNVDISGFVKVRNTELPCILTKMSIDFFKKVISRSPMDESAPDRFVRVDDNNYLMKTDAEILEVGSVKHLIELLDDYSQELTEFAKKEKISGRSQSGAEMAKVLDYFQTLGNDL